MRKGMTSRTTSIASSPGQAGAALITALVVLLVLTLIGVSGMQTTALEERMSGNTRDRNLAFQAAEVALRDGETYLANVSVNTISVGFNGSNGLYNVDTAPAPSYLEVSWPTSAVAFSGTLAGSMAAPEYIIEELNAIPATSSSLEAGAALPDIRLYRVTARGEGQAPGTVVVLQSVFRR